MRYLLLFMCVLLAGCSTMGGGNAAQSVALENVLLALVGQATGVYLNNGTCVPPAIPPTLLNPCAPVPPTASQAEMQAALAACVTNSAVLVAVTKYQQRVCTPTATPIAAAR